MDTITRVLDLAALSGHVTVDLVAGHDGPWGVAIVTGGSYFFIPKRDDTEWAALLARLSEQQLVCFDVRKLLSWPLSRPVHDVKLMNGGDSSLGRLAKNIISLAEFNELDAKMLAHARAAKTARLGHLPVPEVVPKELLAAWVKARVVAIDRLYTMGTPMGGMSVDEIKTRWDFILALRQTEAAGIHVDDELAAKMLPVSGGADAAFIRSVQNLSRDGYVTALFNPVGTKTGRLRLEAGFNAHGVPNSPVRKVVNSRFANGSIFTLDFNAIDYRCIVKSIGGEFAEIYKGVDDFHERTTRLLFSQSNNIRRKIIKSISYAYIYGGSEDTIVQTTGLSKPYIQAALTKLDQHIHPIAEFRETLHAKAKALGRVQTPGGKIVYVENDDHPGKVLGLYAQSYSSWVFEQAFVVAHRMLRSRGNGSSIIFSVHDELVVDVHPDDDEFMNEVGAAMQDVAGGGWVIRIKKGGNYGEQTERRADLEKQGAGGEAGEQAPSAP